MIPVHKDCAWAGDEIVECRREDCATVTVQEGCGTVPVSIIIMRVGAGGRTTVCGTSHSVKDCRHDDRTTIQSDDA